MFVFRFESGELLVPVRAEDPETGLLGDGMAVVTEDDPSYEKWLPSVTETIPGTAKEYLEKEQASVQAASQGRKPRQ